MIVLNESSLTLIYRDGNSGLLILVSSESLGLFGRDNSSTWNNLCHNTANSFDTERKGCNIYEKKIFGFF